MLLVKLRLLRGGFTEPQSDGLLHKISWGRETRGGGCQLQHHTERSIRDLTRKVCLGRRQDHGHTLHTMWQVLRGYVAKSRIIGVQSHDPPQIAGKCFIPFPREGAGAFPGASVPGSQGRWTALGVTRSKLCSVLGPAGSSPRAQQRDTGSAPAR